MRRLPTLRMCLLLGRHTTSIFQVELFDCGEGYGTPNLSCVKGQKMLNRNPSKSSNVINSYRKRRMQKGPFLVYGAIALVVIGLIVIGIWLFQPDQPLGAMLATDTPTATLTFTPTNTTTPTVTSTITETPTVTLTFTPSGPQPYTIQENDSLVAIAERFNLGEDGVLLILDENPQIMTDQGGVIRVGDVITIPAPGTTRSTSTPIPADLPRGRLIDYQVLPGDTLAGIAVRFNSLSEDIIEANGIEDANALQVGQTLKIPVNLVTATATLPSTSTPVTPTVAGQAATATLAPTTAASGPTATTQASSAQCAFQENNGLVTQLQTLINNERTSNGLTALNVNTQLAQAAKAHAVDMLCNDYFSHRSEANGSTPETRVSQTGFTASLVVETIYAAPNATPQQALDWWKARADDNDAIRNANTTLIGISYVTSNQSLFGSYFVVVMANP